jgi:phosphomannomutase
MSKKRQDDALQFGTSGLRGPAEAFTDQVVALYVAVFESLFQHNGTLLIGRDLRASSPRIAHAVATGAAANGARAIDCGVLPTPALALAAMERGTLAVMVTGSHIPGDRNGLKFYRANGEITKDDEANIASVVAASDPVETVKPIIESADIAAAYASRYRDFWAADALGGLRIGVWEHSSAAREILPKLLEELGAEVAALGRSDGFVAVDTEAIDPGMRKQLAGWVADHALDALVSTDGDADRPLIVDGDGISVPGDIIGPIAARALGANRIVTTVSANTNVERMGSFERVVRCKIGSPFVIAAMADFAREDGAKTIGYEPNGGLILGFEARLGSKRLAPLMTRDAMLPIITVLAAARPSSLRGLVDRLPNRRTATDRLTDVPRGASLALTSALIAGDSEFLPDGLGEVRSMDTTDGARMTFEGDVIVTVRPSGNAPELRCYVEAESDERAREILAVMLSKLHAALDAFR